MRIIEITALDNGAHRNQEGTFRRVPEGWAVIPPSLVLPDTFPFVELTVEGQTVIAMEPGTVPEPEPVPEPEDMEAAILETLLDQELRISALELGV